MAQGVDLEVIRAIAANRETWQAQLDGYREMAVESRRRATQLQQALRAPRTAEIRERMEEDLEECLNDAQGAEDAMREHLKHRPSPVLEATLSASEGDATSPAPAPAPASNTAAQRPPSPLGSPKEDANRSSSSSSRPNVASPECSLAPTPTIDRSSFRTTTVLSPARSKPPSPAVQAREDSSLNGKEEDVDSASTFLGKQLEVRNDGYPSDMSRILDSPGEDARQERLRRKQRCPSDHQDGTLSPTSMASSLQSLKFALSSVRGAASFSSSRRQVSMGDDDGSSSDDDSSDDEDFHYSPPRYLKDIGVEEKSKEWMIAQSTSNHGTRQIKKALWRAEKRLNKQFHKVSTRKQVSGLGQKIDHLGKTTGVSLSTVKSSLSIVNSKLDTIIEDNATRKEEASTLKKENGQLRKELMAHIAAKAAAKITSSRSGVAVISTHGSGDERECDAIVPPDLALMKPSATVLGPSIAGSAQGAGIGGGGGDFPSLSSTTATASATQQDSASGADRSALILESHAAGRTVKARADSSTVELASSSTDNPRLTAPTKSAGTIEETTTVVGADAARAHGTAIASADTTSDPMMMALAIDNGSASGASRPAVISAPPVAEPLPLADGSTVELASSGTANPVRPASNANAGTIEDAMSGVPCHNIITSADAMDFTSNASGLLSGGTVNPPHKGSNRTAATKLDTNDRQSGPRRKASTGPARSTSATTPSIAPTARTGVGKQKSTMRLDEAAATGPEDEKENKVAPANSKSKSITRGLSPSTLTDNTVSLDLARHVAISKAALATSIATGKTKLKLSRQAIDDLCERIDAVNKDFPKSHHDVYREIDGIQKRIIQILEDGVFLSSKAAKKFGAFLVTKVTDVRLNPSQPNLCNGWREVTVTLVQQVHIVSQDVVVCDKFQKLIAPPLHSLCQSYTAALKSSVGPIRTNAREAVRHLMSLLKYPVFSDLLTSICSGLLTGEDHILQESCAQLLLYAVALGSEASILKVENGRPGLWVAVGEKKIAKGLVSKALIAGMCASKDFVRRDTRVAVNLLFARKELGQIKSAVEDKLPANRLKALEDSLDYCNAKWANEGQLWCKDNGYLSQS